MDKQAIELLVDQSRSIHIGRVTEWDSERSAIRVRDIVNDVEWLVLCSFGENQAGYGLVFFPEPDDFVLFVEIQDGVGQLIATLLPFSISSPTREKVEKAYQLLVVFRKIVMEVEDFLEIKGKNSQIPLQNQIHNPVLGGAVCPLLGIPLFQLPATTPSGSPISPKVRMEDGK